MKFVSVNSLTQKSGNLTNIWIKMVINKIKNLISQPTKKL